MKKLINFLVFMLLVFLVTNCKKDNLDVLNKYSKPFIKIANVLDKKINKTEELYKNNLININNGCPFYILRLNAFLLLKKPDTQALIPGEYISLHYGDIVFPVKEKNPVKNYFYVRTIDNKYGWIYSGYGISLNSNEDPDLYFFSDKYYLKSYIDSKGNIDNSNKIILAKNVVPMLLGNFETVGWFYPEDYNLALEISKYCGSIMQYKRTRFYAASIVYNWNYNEQLITLNLLADCYQKLRYYDKAEKIHLEIIKKYFWRSYDNCPLVGGLNSIVKLEMIYLEQLKEEKIGSGKYNEIKDKIIEHILIVGDKHNTLPALDKKWRNRTFAEWLIEILNTNLPREEFYSFAKELTRKTKSSGFADMVNIYVAIEMYNEDRKEEALAILTAYKPKDNLKITLRLNDWLSTNKAIPDAIIYQYKRF